MFLASRHDKTVSRSRSFYILISVTPVRSPIASQSFLGNVAYNYRPAVSSSAIVN